MPLRATVRVFSKQLKTIPMTIENTQDRMLDIVTALSLAKKEVQINTNNGNVHINATDLNFTYIGKWGNDILMHCIKKNCLNDFSKKLTVLCVHMELYSQNIGGITITTF